MDILKYIYGVVNDWIKVADQKALVFGSFNLAGIAYQLVNVSDIKSETLFVQLLSAVSAAVSIGAFFCWVSIIYPRLDNKSKKSKLYFLHIANRFETDIDAGIKEYEVLDETDLIRDLASQIVVNSIVAKKKYRYIQIFSWLFSTQMATLFLLIVITNI
jgi:uncharacterized membrane protein YhhN